MLEQTVKRGKQRFAHRSIAGSMMCRCATQARDALIVNWFEIEIINTRGETTYRNSFVTDLPVGPGYRSSRNLPPVAGLGWKIENETFNVSEEQRLQPYEHNFGHGKQESRRYPGELEPRWPSPSIPFATSAMNFLAQRTDP